MLKLILLMLTLLLFAISCDSNSLSSEIKERESLLVIKYENNPEFNKIGIMDTKGNYLKTIFPTLISGSRINPSGAKISNDRNFIALRGYLQDIICYYPSWIINIAGSIEYTYTDGYGVCWDANYNRLFMGPDIQYYDLQERERRVILIAPDLPWAYYPNLYFYSGVRDQSPYHSGEFAVTNRYEYLDSLGNNKRDFNLIIYNIFTDKRTYVLREFEKDINDCRFSPVDSIIAFTSYQKNQKDIYLITMSGQRLRLIVEDIYLLSDISWSPDGQKIAYSKELPEDIPNVFILILIHQKRHRLHLRQKDIRDIYYSSGWV